MNVRNTKTYRNRLTISPDRCKQLLRFESESVDFLTEFFVGNETETRGGALSPRNKMEIFLRYLSDPGYQSGVAEDIGVDRSTVTKTFSSVLDKIVDKAHHWIKFPSTFEEMNEAKEEWSAKFHIPSVIGALDCTHIEIKKPKEFGDEYINRKGRPTINVQTTCNANEVITSIDAQWPGSVHDGRIWRNSAIQQVLKTYDGSACLLGDSGYGISPWLMTPIETVHNAQEQLYNITHAQERVVIERVFGQLKQRFPILANRVRISVQKIPKLIVSCAVLHNISKHLNDGWDFEYNNLDHHIDDFQQGEIQLDGNEHRIRRRGQRKRLEIVQYLNTL